jgi:hypothetical protein
MISGDAFTVELYRGRYEAYLPRPRRALEPVWYQSVNKSAPPK